MSAGLPNARPRFQGAAVKRSAPIFAALGDETRLRLIVRLSANGATSITNLTEGSHLTRQAIAKHLQVLARAGLVRGTRQGRESLWELQPDKLDDARGWLKEISEQWNQALGRLKHFVERELLLQTNFRPCWIDGVF